MKKYTLPKEFAEKWVAALRSGEYKQITGMLFNEKNNSYCCLGVACSLSKISKSFMTENKANLLANENFRVKKHLPVGIRDINLNRDLATMNDGGKKFPEIADWITENVEFI